jgi:hypothetical protein
VQVAQQDRAARGRRLFRDAQRRRLRPAGHPRYLRSLTSVSPAPSEAVERRPRGFERGNLLG